MPTNETSSKKDLDYTCIELVAPFDAHMHWRQAGMLGMVAPYSISQLAGGLLMPNTTPKVETVFMLEKYREEVFETIKRTGKDFLPIFTFYLTPDLVLKDVIRVFQHGLVHGIKYYPKGGTTNSDKGADGFSELRPILEMMQQYGIPLLIHGETPVHNGDVVDDFEREEVFLETEMVQLVNDYPGLRIVLEHITTEAAAQFVLEHENVRATITPHHVQFDRRALYNGLVVEERGWNYDHNKNGSHADFMCRPILKNARNVSGLQAALMRQAKEGLKKFGLGTDTAPHPKEKKYCECGACGVFTAPIALELYAMAFEEMGILEHLPTFACDVMPEFYGIKDQLPKRSIVLERRPQNVQADYHDIVTPFAGQAIPWTARELAS